MTAPAWETFTFGDREWTARRCPHCSHTAARCAVLGQDGAACCGTCAEAGPAITHDRRAVDDPLLVPGTTWRLAPPGLDPAEWDAEQLQAFIVCALRSRDMPAVAGALQRLAVVDYRAADEVLTAFHAVVELGERAAR